MKRLGVVGTMVWDTIHGRGDSAEPIEEWGGIAYALAALEASLPSDWEMVPLIKVGHDLASRANDFLAALTKRSGAGRFIEVQGTAEGHAFTEDEFTAMLTLAREGVEHVVERQKEALASANISGPINRSMTPFRPRAYAGRRVCICAISRFVSTSSPTSNLGGSGSRLAVNGRFTNGAGERIACPATSSPRSAMPSSIRLAIMCCVHLSK